MSERREARGPHGPEADAADVDPSGVEPAGAHADGTPGAGPLAFDAARIATDIQRRLGVRAQRDVVLARHTTMRVGGPADLYAAAHNQFELRALVRFARSRAIPHLILGRGSNVVISDAGVRGLVIHVRAEGHRIDGDRLSAEAGVALARAATVTAAAGLSGMEFGLAIPGNVGGAVWGNAGAHGADIAGVLESATVLLADGTEATLGPSDLRFAYRDSRLRHGDPAEPPAVVLGATFRLTLDDVASIRARLAEIRSWRQAHQPLGIPSAGSVFRNPPDGSAGALIEAAGFKGRRIGGAMVSEKHANWILNDANGSASDVRRLAQEVRAGVEQASGVRLAFEVVFAGDWSAWPGETP